MNAVKRNRVLELCISILISSICPTVVVAMYQNYAVVNGHMGNKFDSNTLRLVHVVCKLIIFLHNYNNIILLAVMFASVTKYKCENSFLNLLQVFRHGERTPADTYPLDPYINSSWEPFGWGQLTNASEHYYFCIF